VATGTHAIRYLSRTSIDECVRAVSDFLPDVMPTSIRSLAKVIPAGTDLNRKAA
jgi:hypothetical protein